MQEAALFNGEFDAGPAVVGVHAGAGGTDSQDWAEMLLRMYLRWAERRGFKTEILEATPGEEAGLKSATFTLTGENAYGLHAGREGRPPAGAAVPIRFGPPPPDQLRAGGAGSPGRRRRGCRHRRDDLRIDTYRAQGAGGQHVNKTDSAVRITHIPTNIVVQCQNERSQLAEQGPGHAHPQVAPDRAGARAAGPSRQERGESQDISFGSQIRSYVLHPYTMVKDHRTEVKIGNAQGVLDGDLDELDPRLPASARNLVGCRRSGPERDYGMV